MQILCITRFLNFKHCSHWKKQIVLITETLPKSSLTQLQESEFQISNHDILTNFNLCYKLGGRGLAIYKRNQIQVEPNTINSKFKEHMSISIHTQKNNLFDVHLVYRSPNSPNTNNHRIAKYL